MSSVNAFVAWAGSFALFALAALVFGSFLLRLFGAATMLVPTVFLFSEANLNTADAGSYLVFVPMAFVGLGLWVTGHALHRAQHTQRQVRQHTHGPHPQARAHAAPACTASTRGCL